MPLTKPALVTVTAGQPVTAEGWNQIVTGLSDLYDEVLALGRGLLEVAVTHEGTAVAGARVVAAPLGDGSSILAIPPTGPRTTYLIGGVSDGNWRIHVEATGFNAETRDVAVPREQPVAVDLTLAGVRVPDLFGRGLRVGLDVLADAGIGVDLILDTTGREISRTSLPPEYESTPILAQDLAPGTVVPAGTGRVRLVSASALRREPVVTMPSLIGLTYDEVVTVLNRLGLQVGTTTVRETSGT